MNKVFLRNNVHFPKQFLLIKTLYEIEMNRIKSKKKKKERKHDNFHDFHPSTRLRFNIKDKNGTVNIEKNNYKSCTSR